MNRIVAVGADVQENNDMPLLCYSDSNIVHTPKTMKSLTLLVSAKQYLNWNAYVHILSNVHGNGMSYGCLYMCAVLYLFSIYWLRMFVFTIGGYWLDLVFKLWWDFVLPDLFVMLFIVCFTDATLSIRIVQSSILYLSLQQNYSPGHMWELTFYSHMENTSLRHHFIKRRDSDTYNTSLTLSLFSIEVPLSSQESGRLCICVLEVSILPLLTICLLDFRTFPTVGYFASLDNLSVRF